MKLNTNTNWAALKGFGLLDYHEQSIAVLSFCICTCKSILEAKRVLDFVKFVLIVNSCYVIILLKCQRVCISGQTFI